MERILLIIAVAASGVSCLNPYSDAPTRKLHGIDIDRYDYDMPNIRWAARDFALVQVTAGSNFYTSRACAEPVDALLNNSMLVGVYHKAGDRSVHRSEQATAKEEAEWFIENSIMYRGLAVPILVWDDHDGCLNTDWAETWLYTVAKKWGVKPWIRLWPETVKKDHWDSVARAGYPLWLDESDVPDWKRASEPSATKHWSAPIVWRERKAYTGVTGRKVGWDIFYGNQTDWLKHVTLRLPVLRALKEISTNSSLAWPVLPVAVAGSTVQERLLSRLRLPLK